ncbi:cytochrome c peroxidase [uncultured Microscilla sp.]|uniref:cytochrome-c peroxidase n=1 Tax=uncultured Microscilla sp. TaxID=432653 RepID=UPI00261A73F5|nr:cytochrome c peroxidase [uncultured Microscilla sp.]
MNLPSEPYNYSNITLPNHFQVNPVQVANNTPSTNPVTDLGSTLGRVLFYDKNLSANNTIACGSCHLQSKSFTDPAQFSNGFEGGKTGRHSMSLANALFYENGKFFWDERAATLEDQVLMPIQDQIEMGMTLENLVPKLQALDYYKVLFRQTYGDTTVTTERISKSLAQFIRSMVSYQSKYDEALNGQNGPTNPGTNLTGLTAEENLGRQVFSDPARGGCAGCHSTDLFIGREALNNGLDATTTDKGLAGVTGLATDEGKFKVPSLRNVALTAPYMHDGRFATLEQVIEHYNSGVKAHPALDNRLKAPGTNQPKRLNLTAAEKTAVVAFLNTLTDNTFINDEKFADPFK